MRLPPRLVPVLSLAGLLGLASVCSGCGGGHDLAEKQLADVRAELTRLRASQATMAERLDALEIERGSFQKGAGAATPPAPATRPAPAAPAAPNGPAGDGDRPSLDVVRLSPSEGDGDADVDGQRPVIRASGADGSITKAPRAPSKKGVAAAAAPKKASSDTDPRPTAKP